MADPYGVWLTALDVAVTTTTAQTIFSHTPPIAGHFRISGTVTYGGSGGTSALTLLLTFTSPWEGATNYFMAAFPFSGNAFPSMMNGTNAWVAAKTYPLVTMSVQLVANQPMTIVYTSPNATPNDHVSIIVEKIA